MIVETNVDEAIAQLSLIKTHSQGSPVRCSYRYIYRVGMRHRIRAGYESYNWLCMAAWSSFKMHRFYYYESINREG